ncbi:flagellar hook-associated protein 3 FlgL [Alteromonadaceae bacterium Bs31]|nr:flagellar hook-associated protein 3 FlgL [Alteromonadaceae bacterium Bs31]
MRISSLQIFNIANKGMAEANQSLIKTQEQLSTGVRVLNPSDDPVASTKIMQLTNDIANITQYRKNIDIAENNLVLEESSLKSASNLLQRIQELAVQAGNTATLSPSEYSALASEVDARLDELKNLLNSQNANGDYIFGGYKSRGAPFDGSSSSGFNYRGDDGQQFIKIANNTTIAASDSGKALFVDVESAKNTVTTSASPANRSQPPVGISVGLVYDQEAFDEFYPEDMLVTFNADNAVVPAAKNYTITERATGRVIVANQPYVAGTDIEANGVRFRISGQPVSGDPAVAATRTFGNDGPVTFPFDFTAPADETLTIRVGGRSETLVLDGLVSNTADLSSILNNVGNGNAAALAALGVTVDNTGFQVASGVNFSVLNGSANIDGVMGLNTNIGTSSDDGVQQTPGDRLFVDSSNKQDVLTTLARFSEGMKDYDGTQESRATLEETVASTIQNLKNAQTSILDVKSKLGARFNTLDSTRELHLDSEIVMKEVLGELRDVDYAEASTRLASQSLVLQAAQSSFVRVSRLNLFSQL